MLAHEEARSKQFVERVDVLRGHRLRGDDFLGRELFSDHRSASRIVDATAGNEVNNRSVQNALVLADVRVLLAVVVVVRGRRVQSQC